MTQEEKDLILKDICARLPYGVKATTTSIGWTGTYTITGYNNDRICLDCPIYDEGDDEWLVESVKPYLRPMSSMTEEENIELSKRYVFDIVGNKISIRYHCEGYWDDDTECPTSEYIWLIDWLLKHHFDYRGLIDMGLALPAPEDMY